MMSSIGPDKATRHRLVSASMGQMPYDLLITNICYLNMSTSEIYRADIGIVDGYIAYVSPPGMAGRLQGKTTYDGNGKYALPGFIDTHVHIESSMLTPANFARQVLPSGTTTVLADPHEICNVMGIEGMRYFHKASEGLPLDIFFAAPSCVPSVVGIETSHTCFGPDEIKQMLDMPRVIALGEVMDFVNVINQEKRMWEILEVAKNAGVLIQGHLSENTSHELAAYLAAGCISDHETRGYVEAMDKLRAGLTLECRFSSNCHNMPVIAKALAQCAYPANATICTDDREPDDLIKEGHVDEVIRQAIYAGMPPIEAIRLATQNAARFLGLHDRGLLTPGSIANIVLTENLEKLRVDEVFIRGELWAKGNALQKEIVEPSNGISGVNSVILKKKPEINDFLIPSRTANDVKVSLNYIRYNPEDPFLTKPGTADFPIKDGFADICADDGFVTMCVFERHGVNGNFGIAPVENLGMKRGAVAGTVSHDCHNLFVIGTNPQDMLMAVNTLTEAGGGFCCIENGSVSALLKLPICGLISPKSADKICVDIERLKKTLASFGINAYSPLNLLTAFSLAVIPEIRLTDCGLINTGTQSIIPLYANE